LGDEGSVRAYRRTVGLLGFALVVAGATVLACGKTIDSGEVSAGGDASPDVSIDHASAPDSSPCCPPAGPGCCMDYGGWRPPGNMCGGTCDGMPLPTDPDWKIVLDQHGCPRWTNPHDYFRGGTMSSTVRYCGAYQPSGDDVDAGDAAADGRD
jgi:hypothetical protein